MVRANPRFHPRCARSYADTAIVERYVEIVRRRRNARRPENVKDAWIAAAALAHSLPLITFDRRGFNDIPDLDLILLRTD